MEIELKENERIDDLEFKNLKIIQNTRKNKKRTKVKKDRRNKWKKKKKEKK